MPFPAFRRAAATLSLLCLFTGLPLVPAMAQLNEMEKLKGACEAYDAKNYDKAFYDWLGLCQAGNRGACFNLGLMYANGTGAPQDYVESYKWMHLAAEAGLPEAIRARAEQWKIDVGRR